MKMTMKIALAAACVLGLIAASALAADTKVDTKVSIENYTYSMGSDTVTFYGNVKSDGKCKADRPIVLKQVTDHIKAGVAETNADGDWKVKFKGADVPGRVFKAVAEKTVVTKRRHGHVVSRKTCEKAVSKAYDVQDQM